MKVAVIDDDPTVLDLMQGILQDMGNEAATRPSAVGASAWILRERPDIVLVDLDMPALSGEAWLDLITREALTTREGYEPSVVVLSGKPVAEIERVVAESCAIGYIRKQDGPEGFEAAFQKITAGLSR